MHFVIHHLWWIPFRVLFGQQVLPIDAQFMLYGGGDQMVYGDGSTPMIYGD